MASTSISPAGKSPTEREAPRRLLLLIPSTSYKASDFLAAAERLEVAVAVGSDQRQVLEDHADGLTATLDFRDLEKGCRQILDYAARHPLAAIIGVEDTTLRLAAEASARLDLAQNSPASVARSVNKHAQRLALAAAGLRVPDFRLVSAKETAAAATRLPYPVVAKPLGLAASRGVIRADGPADFLVAAARIRLILSDPQADILVESFLPGREIALEALLVGGELHPLALFDKPDPLDGPFFEETLYVTPARLEEEDRRALLASAEATARALGLKEGPLHAEFRLNADGVWPLEMAARTIGGLCGRSLRFDGGMSLEELVLRHAFGTLPPRLAAVEGASGVLMIPIAKAGRLVSISGQAKSLLVPGIEDLRITVPIGREVLPLPEGDRYLGFIFARAGTPDAVEKALRRAHACLEIGIA